MSTLLWMCALTLALVCCLGAQPQNDMKIYSPDDLPQDCLSSALNCTVKGLELIEYECDLTGEKENDLNVFDKFYTGLDDAEKKTSPSPSSCKVCEMYPTKNVEEFLESIKSLVERW
ncbi:unnamed protein product [Leuciscus chuanchicus]